MMRMMNNKKNVKIFSIVIAAIFIIGIGALAYTQMATPGTSAASNVGVIDMSRLDNPENPVYVKAAKEFTDYRSQVAADMQAKVDAAQDDATKAKIKQEAQANVEKKMEEMNKQMADQTMEAAKARNADLVIVDTAGRLHTKVNLMEELKKMGRVANNHVEGAPHQTLLVLDGTTGQNAVSQAKLFGQAVPVNGIVVTKLDGTAKGGVVISIKEELGVPVRWIGVGEGMDDLRPFNAKEFANALFNKGMIQGDK
ncbi:MAG: hypothetical protein E7G02_01360 [Veillonella sp.]|nr:hypothetical protein [Veillonella sp.]